MVLVGGGIRHDKTDWVEKMLQQSAVNVKWRRIGAPFYI